MATVNEKLEKVQYINNKNIDLVHKRFTGKLTIHWQNGEPKKEEYYKFKHIDLEK